MKVCLVNVNNGINYSQYGPFLFEHIRNQELSFYSVNDTDELYTIRDNIISEVNRDAFSTEEIFLIFVIARDMENVEVNEYDIYNKINIYEHICTGLPVSIHIRYSIIYIDKYNSVAKGKEHYFDDELSKTYITDDEKFAGYLPLGSHFSTKMELAEAIDKITVKSFKNFFQRVLDDINEGAEKMLKNNGLVNFFAGQCSEKIPEISRIHEIIPPQSIEVSIKSYLKVVYFIKALALGECKLEGYEDFKVDFERCKEEIATYRERLSGWIKTKADFLSDTKIQLEEYLVEKNASVISEKLNDIIQNSLKNVDVNRIKESSVTTEIFGALEKIVKNADDEVKKFAMDCTEDYFDDENYDISNVDLKQFDNPIDRKNHEKNLIEDLNKYTVYSLPTFKEQLKLEQKLKNADEKIQNLFRSKEAYKLKAFLGTLLFSVSGIAVLYFIAQVSVFVKENSFIIYLIYCGVLTGTFLTVFPLMSNNIQKKIRKVLQDCKDDVKNYLLNYQRLAEDFENNIHAMAAYHCFKKYLYGVDNSEKEISFTKLKYSWHIKKIKEILTNLEHFNDFTKNAEPQIEEKNVTLDNFDNDAEHTEFYQLKIF